MTGDERTYQAFWADDGGTDNKDGWLSAVCRDARSVPRGREILDEDYALELVHPTVARMPRARWLEVLADYVVHAYDVQEQVISIDGDCAVVLHRVVMHATVLGEDRSGPFVITDIWRRRDGPWRLWRRHSTPISAGDMPGVRS